MKCLDVENYLDDFVNDDLDAAIQQKIRLHLSNCPFCQNEAEEAKATNLLLKNLPSVTPSNQFDERMMQAFRAHQKGESKHSFWSAIFANLATLKPALAGGLLALAIVSILAFQLGRMTAPNIEIAQTENINPAKSAENNLPVQIVEKRIEVPVVKTVEVPVYKEKIVNRVIYKDREVIKTIEVSEKNEIRDVNFDPQNTAITFVQNGNENFTPINLKDFQPASEIKVRITKRGDENED